MSFMSDNDTQRTATKRDILDTILRRPVPPDHVIESNMTIVTHNSTVVINVYASKDGGRPPEPDVITVPHGDTSAP